MNSIVRLMLALAIAGAATPAPGKVTPLPADSVYQRSVVLTNQQGRKADWATRRGRPQLVTMFYTSCKFMCPLLVDSGKAVQKNLTPAQRARVDLLYISMDPERDSPKALAAVASQRKLDPARWTLARPAASDVRSIAGLLGVRYRRLQDGEFNHTSVLLLLDADGRIVARTDKMGSQPDPEFLAAVRRVANKG